MQSEGRKRSSANPSGPSPAKGVTSSLSINGDGRSGIVFASGIHSPNSTLNS
jgi:hypothetical protein